MNTYLLLTSTAAKPSEKCETQSNWGAITKLPELLRNPHLPFFLARVKEFGLFCAKKTLALSKSVNNISNPAFLTRALLEIEIAVTGPEKPYQSQAALSTLHGSLSSSARDLPLEMECGGLTPAEKPNQSPGFFNEGAGL